MVVTCWLIEVMSRNHINKSMKSMVEVALGEMVSVAFERSLHCKHQSGFSSLRPASIHSAFVPFTLLHVGFAPTTRSEMAFADPSAREMSVFGCHVGTQKVTYLPPLYRECSFNVFGKCARSVYIERRHSMLPVRRKHRASPSEVNTRHNWPSPTEGRSNSLVCALLYQLRLDQHVHSTWDWHCLDSKTGPTLGLCLGETRESPHWRSLVRIFDFHLECMHFRST